jgi:hypothetical protein
MDRFVKEGVPSTNDDRHWSVVGDCKQVAGGQRGRPLMLMPAPEGPDDVQDGGDRSRANE